MSNEGVIQYGSGIFCLACRKYFCADLVQFPLVRHPGALYHGCSNSGKTFQIPTLKEVN